MSGPELITQEPKAPKAPTKDVKSSANSTVDKIHSHLSRVVPGKYDESDVAERLAQAEQIIKGIGRDAVLPDSARTLTRNSFPEIRAANTLQRKQKQRPSGDIIQDAQDFEEPLPPSTQISPKANILSRIIGLFSRGKAKEQPVTV